MLEFLTKSKIRQRIILLFLYNQNREFYLSEVARLARTTPGTAQRELNRLVKSDFIYLNKRGGINNYKLNNRYSLLAEVESIVRKTFGIEVELRNALSKIKNIHFAFLFGSYAMGGFRSDSDIDLFIIGNVDENLVHKIVLNIENTVQREINYHLSDRKEFVEKLKANRFHKEILNDSVLLVGDPDEFKGLARNADQRRENKKANG